MHDRKLQEFVLPYQFAADQMFSVIEIAQNDILSVFEDADKRQAELFYKANDEEDKILAGMNEDLRQIFETVPDEHKQEVYNDLKTKLAEKGVVCPI